MHENYGTKYLTSVYDSDTDISTPKQISIQTVGKKATVEICVTVSAGCKLEINETVVLGTGGSVSAGTAVTSYPWDRAATDVAITLIKQDYILGSSGQSAGTTIYSGYATPYEPIEVCLKLKANTLYGIVLTAIADNTVSSVTIDMTEV